MTSDVIELAREVWLGRLGWEFVPYGPEEWGWRKFIGPKCVAQQGDSAWKVDIELTSHLLALEAVVTAAEEFAARGTVLTACDRGPCQRVVEAKDNSDPQARLYAALAALDKLKEGR